MTTPIPGDRTVWPILTALKTCAEYWLSEAGRPPCHFARVWNGQHPPADACDCDCPNGGQGQAWVRMVTRNSASGTAAATCAGGLHDLTVELGVYRCSPVPQPPEATVPVETEETHAAGMYRDAQALLRAIYCCDWLDRHHLTPDTVVQNAIGPSGGCVGVETQAHLQVVDCLCGGAE